jgi:uncharacterized membrane protein YwaF
MNFIERVMVQHANPFKLTLDVIGIILAVYFLWQRNWFWTIVALFGLSILGTIIAWGKDENKLAQTKLGKFMLGQARPANLLVRVAGAILLGYGLWMHSLPLILLGICVVIIARRFGKIKI